MLDTCERNYVGSIMLCVFAIGTTLGYLRCAMAALLAFCTSELVEMLVVFPLSLTTVILLFWTLFDYSVLNFDSKRDREWRHSRWIKFLPLLLLPVGKFCTGACWREEGEKDVALAVTCQTLDALTLVVVYIALSLPHATPLARLFQPFTVPRRREYRDEKGQRFETNIIGVMLTILLLIWPFSHLLAAPLGRLLFLRWETVASGTKEMLVRIIVDGCELALVVYSLTVLLLSCTRVKFFSGRFNCLKFAPVVLTPVVLLVTGHWIPIPGVDPNVANLTLLLLVTILAYLSILSAPDSLFAVLFHPHVPMISTTVSDLPSGPDPSKQQRQRTNVVFAS